MALDVIYFRFSSHLHPCSFPSLCFEVKLPDNDRNWLSLRNESNRLRLCLALNKITPFTRNIFNTSFADLFAFINLFLVAFLCFVHFKILIDRRKMDALLRKRNHKPGP